MALRNARLMHVSVDVEASLVVFHAEVMDNPIAKPEHLPGTMWSHFGTYIQLEVPLPKKAIVAPPGGIYQAADGTYHRVDLVDGQWVNDRVVPSW